MQRIHAVVANLARLMAVLGGAVLTLLILIVCISIIGRAANSVLYSAVDAGILPGLAQWLIDAGVGAVRGDFEMVQAGMAFCIFAFLPFCQITYGHACVDIFTPMYPRPMNRALDVIIAVLFAVALVVIAMQLNEGMARKLRSGQTTMLLGFPLWWAYAASLFGATVAALAAVYVALIRIIETLTGRVIIQNAAGANH